MNYARFGLSFGGDNLLEILLDLNNVITIQRIALVQELKFEDDSSDLKHGFRDFLITIPTEQLGEFLKALTGSGLLDMVEVTITTGDAEAEGIVSMFKDHWEEA